MLTYQGNSLSNKAVPDEGRTSYSAYLDKADPIMECIGARALDFHGGVQRMPHAEAGQVIEREEEAHRYAGREHAERCAREPLLLLFRKFHLKSFTSGA